nr:hypothetical protein [Tanacetum cinerariifolium]
MYLRLDGVVPNTPSEEPMYDEVKFRKTFRMARPLFNEIVTAVIDHNPFFRNNIECTGKEGISELLKCTSSIRQLAYGVHAEFLDEYMQISKRSSHLTLDHFCLKARVSGDVRNPDCTDWEWFSCPYAFKAQYIRRDHGPNPFILLEAVASQDLWIWHAFFGVAGSNNDINGSYMSNRDSIANPRSINTPHIVRCVNMMAVFDLSDGRKELKVFVLKYENM